MQIAVLAAVIAAAVAIFAGHHAKAPTPIPVAVVHHVASIHHAVVPVPTPAPVTAPIASSPVLPAPAVEQAPVQASAPAPVAPVAVVAQVEKPKASAEHYALTDIGILAMLAVIIVWFFAKRMKPKAKAPAPAKQTLTGDAVSIVLKSTTFSPPLAGAAVPVPDTALNQVATGIEPAKIPPPTAAQ